MVCPSPNAVRLRVCGPTPGASMGRDGKPRGLPCLERRGEANCRLESASREVLSELLERTFFRFWSRCGKVRVRVPLLRDQGRLSLWKGLCEAHKRGPLPGLSRRRDVFGQRRAWSPFHRVLAPIRFSGKRFVAGGLSGWRFSFVRARGAEEAVMFRFWVFLFQERRSLSVAPRPGPRWRRQLAAPPPS